MRVVGSIHAAHWSYQHTHVVNIDLQTAALSGEGPRPTGTVVISDRGVRLGEVPLASLDSPSITARATWMGVLTPGHARLTATYSGDSTYAPALLPETAGWVQNALIEATDPESVESGGQYTLTARVTAIPGVVGTPTGSVTFSPGGGATPRTVPLDGNGVASATFVAPRAGVGSTVAVPYSVHYSGDATFVDWTVNGQVIVY